MKNHGQNHPLHHYSSLYGELLSPKNLHLLTIGEIYLIASISQSSTKMSNLGILQHWQDAFANSILQQWLEQQVVKSYKSMNNLPELDPHNQGDPHAHVTQMWAEPHEDSQLPPMACLVVPQSPIHIWVHIDVINRNTCHRPGLMSDWSNMRISIKQSRSTLVWQMNN